MLHTWLYLTRGYICEAKIESGVEGLAFENRTLNRIMGSKAEEYGLIARAVVD